MRVGLASDSSGDVAALGRAITLLRQTLQCQRVFFLGGNWADVDHLPPMTSTPAAKPPSAGDDVLSAMTAFLAAEAESAAPSELQSELLVRVPERAASDEEHERKQIEMLGNQICLLVHDKADLTKEDIANATLILHGKSKKPAVVRIGARAFITPGSVSGGDDVARVAVLTLEGLTLEVGFYDLQGRQVGGESLNVAGGTRFSAK
ncbi:MAG: hypothetical protein AB2A00_31690 [Myxococcota bacterium]